jgi:hypothetical protein
VGWTRQLRTPGPPGIALNENLITVADATSVGEPTTVADAAGVGKATPGRESPMNPLPTEDMRTNRRTWAVPPEHGPALAAAMVELLPREPYDHLFLGQQLHTTYLDTVHLDLRKARMGRQRYLTLRLRSYASGSNDGETYALSAKTESEKFRLEIDGDTFAAILGGAPGVLAAALPPHLAGRLLVLNDSVVPAVCVRCRRYAVENDNERYTLDCAVHTDTGKCLPFNVLEYKSTDDGFVGDPIPGLRPTKLSKFLWATEV